MELASEDLFFCLFSNQVFKSSVYLYVSIPAGQLSYFSITANVDQVGSWRSLRSLHLIQKQVLRGYVICKIPPYLNCVKRRLDYPCWSTEEVTKCTKSDELIAANFNWRKMFFIAMNKDISIIPVIKTWSGFSDGNKECTWMWRPLLSSSCAAWISTTLIMKVIFKEKKLQLYM